MAHKVQLSWTASTDTVSGYNVYRSAAAGLKTTLLNATPIVGVTYEDDTVTPGNWFYDVTAVENGAESAVSNSVEAVILPAGATNLILVSAV
jgi:hypothetical protein